MVFKTISVGLRSGESGGRAPFCVNIQEKARCGNGYDSKNSFGHTGSHNIYDKSSGSSNPPSFFFWVCFLQTSSPPGWRDIHLRSANPSLFLYILWNFWYGGRLDDFWHQYSVQCQETVVPASTGGKCSQTSLVRRSLGSRAALGLGMRQEAGWLVSSGSLVRLSPGSRALVRPEARCIFFFLCNYIRALVHFAGTSTEQIQILSLQIIPFILPLASYDSLRD